ncbi:MAG: TIGR04255 family protein [Chloroflexi bacterium]|jgi:uncharacterized protein (TIGR04255 family)|nr:TIGR04255 family protein [Chloroflexota bacterium]
MTRVILRNKPLVEAIFELHWELEQREGGLLVDPHTRLLVGRLYDRLEDEYPFHEELPLAVMPDEIAPYAVRHRFRRAENQWPLVQLGPGVVTLNDTVDYVWETFEKRAKRLVDLLFATYPSPEKLAVDYLLLRYIDAVDFDFERENVYEFLRDKLKTRVELLPSLFIQTGVHDVPLHLDLRFAFPVATPRGEMNLRFARGERGGSEALVWEITLVGRDRYDADTKDGITEWLEQAHALTDDWFFKLIEGDLKVRFDPCP